MTIRRALCWTALIVGASVWTPAFAADSTTLMDKYVGRWEGTGTLYYPRDTSRAPRIEHVVASFERVLKGTYVEGNTSWTRTTDGRVRDLKIFFNYDDEQKAYQVLFLYDNWGGIVRYPLTVDTASWLLKGQDTFSAPDGTPAEEHVEWWFSDDGQEIGCREYNHYGSDPEGFWPLNFEFVWKRVE